MYKIIGADNSVYGPSSAEELRQWVREGRADGRTLVKLEGTDDWKPFASFPELASVLPESPLAGLPPAGDRTGLPPGIADRDWSLDIESCIRRGWELVKGNFGPMIGVSLLVFLAMGAVNQLIGLVSHDATTDLYAGHFSFKDAINFSATSLIEMPIQALFTAGLFRYYLKWIRGERAEIGDAFSGFTLVPGQLILLGLVQNLLVMLGILLCVLPGIYLGVAWVFSILLVIDKNLGFWQAMELSRKVVSRHWFVILGLVLVNALVSAAGLLACCVGVLITGPIALASLAYAYEDLFGYRPTRAA